VRTLLVLGLLAAATAPTAAQEAKQAKKKAKQKDPKAKGGTADQVEFGGRVYFRDTLTGVDIGGDDTWIDDKTIDSARVFAVFRPNERTRMDLEVDFAGDQAELKDTFVRYQPVPILELTGGRFKRPVSFIGLESTWDLPRIDRGLLAELRVEDRRLLFAGGRGDGFAAKLEPDAPLRPELTFVVHQSALAEELVLEITEAGQDLFARFDLEPVPGLHLATAAGWVGSPARSGDRDSFRHRPFVTLESFVELPALRVWLEGMAGLNATSYVGGRQIGRFAAAQALIAPRLELAGPVRALEPFAAAGWYEPSTLQPGDQIAELTAGAALWISGKLRLQLEGGRRLAQESAASADATIIRLQLGAAFKSAAELP
jgi:hypothetical protein